MNLTNQEAIMPELNSLIASDRHSILIEGAEGSGKTYIAKHYANLLGCEDFQVVEPKVQSIKDIIDACYQIETKIVICIENLDLGVLAASYAILKFLEEPLPNVYIVVTCRNSQHVPDTIISRSAVVTLSPPKDCDLVAYAKEANNAQYLHLQDTIIWKCAKTFKDVDLILQLTSPQLEYYKGLPDVLKPGSNSTISSMMWSLQKYPDGGATPIDLVIRYIMYTTKSSAVWNICHECLKSLDDGRVATHAVLARFLFQFKYAIA